jgi:hypothetical protein
MPTIFLILKVSISGRLERQLTKPRLNTHKALTSQRPFLNYFAPTFILYELSSPFLNIHWFLDKVNMTFDTEGIYIRQIGEATYKA